MNKNNTYTQTINENTLNHYLKVIDTPGIYGFNFRRPENINKIGILYTNLSLNPPFFTQIFYFIYFIIMFTSSFFIGMGINNSYFQIIGLFITQIILLGFFCYNKFFKHKFIFWFNLILQIIFVFYLFLFLILTILSKTNPLDVQSKSNYVIKFQRKKWFGNNVHNNDFFVYNFVFYFFNYLDTLSFLF